MRVCVCEVENTEVYFHYLFITLPFSFFFFITEEVTHVGVPVFTFSLFFFFFRCCCCYVRIDMVVFG